MFGMGKMIPSSWVGSGSEGRVNGGNGGAFGGSSGPIEPGGVVVVNGKKYSVVRQIGEGGYSFVYQVTDGGRQYALKRMFALSEDPEQIVRLRMEVDLLREVKHKNIVKIVDIQDGSRSFRGSGGEHDMGGGGFASSEVLILMEFCTGGSLADVIIDRSQTKKFFAESEILRIFHQVCFAVSALHLRNPATFHRDLKVENVLISDGCYKLCDFGSATTHIFFPNKENRSRIEEEISRVTTGLYQSPEMADLYRGQAINDKADIWALGCLLFKLAYFILPFNEGERLGILNVRYTIPTTPAYEFIPHLIKRLLSSDPADRPDISELIDELEGFLRFPKSNLPHPSISTQERHQPPSRSVASPEKNGDVLGSLQWFDGGSSSDQTVPPPPLRSSTSSFSTSASYRSRETDGETAFGEYQEDEDDDYPSYKPSSYTTASNYPNRMGSTHPQLSDEGGNYKLTSTITPTRSRQAESHSFSSNSSSSSYSSQSSSSSVPSLGLPPVSTRNSQRTIVPTPTTTSAPTTPAPSLLDFDLFGGGTEKLAQAASVPDSLFSIISPSPPTTISPSTAPTIVPTSSTPTFISATSFSLVTPSFIPTPSTMTTMPNPFSSVNSNPYIPPSSNLLSSTLPVQQLGANSQQTSPQLQSYSTSLFPTQQQPLYGASSSYSPQPPTPFGFVQTAMMSSSTTSVSSSNSLASLSSQLQPLQPQSPQLSYRQQTQAQQFSAPFYSPQIQPVYPLYEQAQQPQKFAAPVSEAFSTPALLFETDDRFS